MEKLINKFLSTNDGSGSGSGYGPGDGDGSGSGFGDGYGFGSGSGYGPGDGSGFGDGSGSGSGYDDGSGDGSGSGYGPDDGSGFGDGSGSGSGFGSGFGDGFGDGYGPGDGSGHIKSFNNIKVYYVDGIPCLFRSIKSNIAKVNIINNDLILSVAFIAKGHDLFVHGKSIKQAISSLQEKIFDNTSVDDKIESFILQFDMSLKYPASKFYEWHNRLTGSCEFGRDNYFENYGINMEDKYTVAQFINLTINEYGGEIISQLKTALL